MRAIKYIAAVGVVAFGFGLLLHADVPHVASGTWVSAGNLGQIPSGAAAAALPDGRLAVFGGALGDGSLAADVAIYDPAASAWTHAGHMTAPRSGHAAAAMPDGRVLIVGGTTPDGIASSIELYDPSTGQSVPAGSIHVARTGHAAATLKNGTVLIAGGSNGSAPLTSAEIINPATANSSVVPFAMSSARANLSATTLLDGRVLITGGSDGQTDLATAELYDAATQTFAPTGSMAQGRSGHVAILLPDNNNVVIAGGSSAGAPTNTAELYAEWNQAFTPAPNPMTAARAGAVGGGIETHDVALVAGGGPSTGEYYGYATVRTDKDDYAPGQVVMFTGSGWQPGETVTLSLREDPPVDEHPSLTAVADASGNIVNSTWSPDAHDVALRFYVTARGAGSEAQTTFTDDQQVLLYHVTLSPLTDGGGASQGYNLTYFNDATSTKSIASVQATLPASYTAVTADLVSGWNATVAGNVVTWMRITKSNEIDPNRSQVFGLHATASCTSQSLQWTTKATFNVGADFSTNTFTNTQPDPTVTATGACGTTSLAVTGFPTSTLADAPHNITVTAKNGGTTITGYRGTIRFTTTNAGSTLPANYTFTAADAGVHTFVNGVSLHTASPPTYSITATDTVTSSITGNQSGITVTAGTAPTITSANNTTFTVGSAGSFTVTATGSPTPTLSETGVLPNGVTFTASTGTLSGTPALGTVGSYPITFTASNGVSPNATQNFTLTVAKTNQATLTVTGAPAGTAPFGTTYSLGTSGGSGTGAVTFSAGTSTACSVSGSTLTITAGSGTCSITATKAADANFNQAISASVGVTVGKAAQATLTANVPSPGTFGQTYTLTTTGGSGTGAVSFSVGMSNACTVVGNQLTITHGTGSCAVTATKAADGDYAGTTSLAALITVVRAASVTVFGSAPSATYLGANFTVRASNDSAAPITYSRVSGPCAVVDAAAGTFSASGAGTCVVQAASAITPDFLASSAQQSVSIAKAQPTVTFAPAPLGVYGATFAVSATTTNSDSGKLTYTVESGSCTATYAPSTYPTLVGAGATAYWRLEETAGPTFVDAKGAHDATVASETGFTYGVGGALGDTTKGLALAATANGSATFSGIPLFGGTAGTVEFWIQPRAVAQNQSGAIVVGDGGGNPGIFLRDDMRLVYRDGTEHANTTPLTAGQLYHVALAIGSSGAGVWYLNGSPDGAVSGVTAFTASRVFNVSDGSAPLGATLVDEIAVYAASALSSSQLSQHFAVASRGSFRSTATGTCTVKASGDETANFLSAFALETVTIAKADQSVIVTVQAPATAAYLSTFGVAATASSSLDVAITVSGPCTISAGGTDSANVHMDSGTGVCTVHYNQSGDGNYNAAPEVTSTTTAEKIAQATLVANVPNPGTFGQTYAVTTTGGSGTGSVSYSVGASNACTIDGDALKITHGTGTCSVTATKAADDNYVEATSAPAAVTLRKADQSSVTVTGPADVTYATTATATATGGNGTGAYSFSAGASTGCTVGGTTVSVSNASGTCVLTAIKAGDNDYLDSATSPTFPVTLHRAAQAAVTATAPADATFGTPGGTATASGGSGTGAYSFDTGASTACAVGASSGVITVTHGTGSCTITARRAGDNNYLDSQVSAPAPLTIHKGTQSTVTVTSPSDITYGTSAIAVATGGNGTGAYSFSAGASTGCTVGGTTVSVSNASGTCVLTAIKAGDNDYVDSAVSAPFPVTPHKAAQAIVSVTGPAGLTYGTTATATAAGGSGTGAFSFSAGGSTGCAVVGTTVSVTNASGTCALTATRGGDNNYNASAPSAPVAVALFKATATVVLSNLVQLYSGTPLTPTVATVPSGLAVSWTNAPQTNVGSYTVSATIVDPNYQGSATATFVVNAAPAVGPIVVVEPQKVNTAFTATANFTDPGSDTHTVSWTWGDGATSPPTGTTTLNEPGATSGSVTGTHTYTAAGIYTVTVRVTDNYGASGTSTYLYAIADPLAGSVNSSGGTLPSAAGAYRVDQAVTGTVTITSLNSRYMSGATVPSGTTRFTFSGSGTTVSFSSANYTWLVVSGNHAWAKGTGTVTINGTAESCEFIWSVVDGQLAGGGGVDKIRLKLWNASRGVIYDNMPNAALDAIATVAVTSTTGTVTILK